MFALTSWDKKVLPGLQRKGILPYISSTDRTLDEQLQRREAEKRAKNLTPITAQHRPAVAELDSQACHYIGTVNGVRQYLCVRKDNAIGEQCDFSEEFSAMCERCPLQPTPVVPLCLSSVYPRLNLTLFRALAQPSVNPNPEPRPALAPIYPLQCPTFPSMPRLPLAPYCPPLPWAQRRRLGHRLCAHCPSRPLPQPPPRPSPPRPGTSSPS
jgi:hypothetical protein